MKLSSSAFSYGAAIPKEYSRDGGNISPPLHIEDVPEEAKSLVLIMDDPDAPSGTFVHWIVFNIPPRTKEIHEDAPPVMATQGRNSWGEVGYGGPQPPSGEHRYFFRLYAIDKMLSLMRGDTRQQVEDAMKDHILDEAELMGKYASSKLVAAK